MIKWNVIIWKQNKKCKSCGEKDGMVSYKISRCCKPAQKYMTKHNWVGKMIHWELCKRLKFDHTIKWYMHKPESLLENEMHKILWDFDIQTDPFIQARRSDLVVINKKIELAVLWILPFQLTLEKKNKMIDKYLDLTWERTKLWNLRGIVIPIVTVMLEMVSKRLRRETKDIVNQRKNQDYPNYRIGEFSQNTEKCPGDLRRLAVTQTPVKDHQLTLVWKTWKK